MARTKQVYREPVEKVPPRKALAEKAKKIVASKKRKREADVDKSPGTKKDPIKVKGDSESSSESSSDGSLCDGIWHSEDEAVEIVRKAKDVKDAEKGGEKGGEKGEEKGEEKGADKDAVVV
jgi:hypothetical protein